MLEWLRAELYKSEEKKERVYILTHMSPIDCLESWANIYNALIDRFSNIIRGQFAGHNHGDLYTVFRDKITNKINNVLFMASSLTTYSQRNPSFRIYEIDLDTLLPIDYNEYRLNLGKWNNSPNDNIEWDLAYTFSKEYKLDDASYESYARLTEMLRTDRETIDRYDHNVKSQIGEFKKIKKNSSINIEYYCGTFPTQSLQNKCKGTELGKLDKIMDYIRGPWKNKSKN